MFLVYIAIAAVFAVLISNVEKFLQKISRMCNNKVLIEVPSFYLRGYVCFIENKQKPCYSMVA